MSVSGNSRVFGGAVLAASLAAVLAPSAAQAQAAPNYGNYQALDQAFRVGVQVTNQATGFTQAQAFQQRTITDITDYIDPSQVATVVGAVNARTATINAVFDLRGATALASYQQNGATLAINFVTPNGQVVSQGNGTPCSFSFAGQTRQAAFDTFDAATDDDDSPTSRALFRCIARSFSRYSPADPLAGNPGSLQATLFRNALDLTSGDSLIEDRPGANGAGDPWIVGASYTTGSAGRFDTNRVDGRIQRSFRLLEGSRALLKFDIPFSYTRIDHAKAYTAQVGVGLEVPVIARRWSLEPRVAYGAVYSSQAGSAGTILQGSITSRYVVGGLGRGRLVIGNMVGYSTTLAPPGVSTDLNPDLKNWAFRNGVAYELPLKSTIGGRSTSVRASYGFTAFAGDKLRNNSFHEATLSFGLRGREESVRGSRDLVRLNLNTVQARGFHNYTVGLGFRF